MMHVPPASFRPDPAQANATAQPASRLRADAYFRLRLHHAGLTKATLAHRLETDPVRQGLALEMVTMLETPGVRAGLMETVRRIAEVMPFDADVYWQLAHDRTGNPPKVCHGCGYTIWDAYSVEDSLLSFVTDTSCNRCTPHADADL